LERVLERFIGRDLIIGKGSANIGRNYVRSVDHASAAVVLPLPEVAQTRSFRGRGDYLAGDFFRLATQSVSDGRIAGGLSR